MEPELCAGREACAWAGELEAGARSEWIDAAAEQKVGGPIVFCGSSCGIFGVSGGHEENHALTGPGEEHAVGIFAISSTVRCFDGAPASLGCVAQIAREPLASGPREVSAPAETNPVELEPLNLELCCVYLASVA